MITIMSRELWNKHASRNPKKQIEKNRIAANLGKKLFPTGSENNRQSS